VTLRKISAGFISNTLILNDRIVLKLVLAARFFPQGFLDQVQIVKCERSLTRHLLLAEFFYYLLRSSVPEVKVLILTESEFQIIRE